MNFNDRQKGIVCFVRHGETAWNAEGRIQGREEIPLNESGIAQAKSCADGFKMANIKWDRVVSSPLGRAYQTAQIIAQSVGCDNVETDERLIERNYGVISGFTYKEYESAIYGDVQNIEGLETTESIISRLDDFIKSGIKCGERVIAVCHGGISRVYAKSVKKAEGLDGNDVVRIQNCHIIIYTCDGENVILEGYNIAPCDIGKFIAKRSK